MLGGFKRCSRHGWGFRADGRISFGEAALAEFDTSAESVAAFVSQGNSETMKFSEQALLAKLVAALLSVFFAQAALAGTPSTEGFRAWVASFRATALAKGIRASVYDSVTRGLVPDFSLPDLDIPSKKQPEQPEFVRTPEQYLSEKNLANLAEQGRRLFAQYKDTLIAIKKTYQIDPYILLAVWGRETAFGTLRARSSL